MTAVEREQTSHFWDWEKRERETERLRTAFIPGLTSFPIPDLTRILNPGQGAEGPCLPRLSGWQCRPVASVGSQTDGLELRLGSSLTIRQAAEEGVTTVPTSQRRQKNQMRSCK